MKKLILVLILSTSFLFSGKVFAATVTCQFMSGTTYSKSGVWIKEGDPMTIMELFGYEGLKLKLENSLLANLDARKIFLAGKTKHGNVCRTLPERLRTLIRSRNMMVSAASAGSYDCN